MLFNGEPQSSPTLGHRDNRLVQSQTTSLLIMPGFIEVWFSPNGNTSGEHQREQASPCAKNPLPSGVYVLGRVRVGLCVHKAARWQFPFYRSEATSPRGP